MADASPVTSPRLIGRVCGFGSETGSLEGLSYAERQALGFGFTVRLQDRRHGRRHGQVYGREQYIRLERQKVE